MYPAGSDALVDLAERMYQVFSHAAAQHEKTGNRQQSRQKIRISQKADRDADRACLHRCHQREIRLRVGLIRLPIRIVCKASLTEDDEIPKAELRGSLIENGSSLIKVAVHAQQQVQQALMSLLTVSHTAAFIV